MEIDRPGTFRVQPLEWGIQEPTQGSQAVAVVIRVQPISFYNHELKDFSHEEWCQTIDPVVGYFYVVKKDGTINDAQVRSLCSAIGWDGDFSKLDPSSGWVPEACQFTIEQDSYNGKVRFRPAWINPWGASPERSTGTTDPNKLRELQNRFGGKLRAVAGNVARNAVAPTGGSLPPRQVVSQPATTQPFENQQIAAPINTAPAMPSEPTAPPAPQAPTAPPIVIGAPSQQAPQRLSLIGCIMRPVSAKATSTGGQLFGINISYDNDQGQVADSWFNTFDPTLAAIGHEAMSRGLNVQIEYHQRQYQDRTGAMKTTFDLDSIVMLAAQPAVSQADASQAAAVAGAPVAPGQPQPDGYSMAAGPDDLPF